MADTPLTEVVSRQQMDFLNVADDLRRAGTLDPRKPDSWPQHMKDRRQVIDAARKWAELEALVADGGRVVVETRNPLWLRQYGSEWKRRIVLGEGAE